MANLIVISKPVQNNEFRDLFLLLGFVVFFSFHHPVLWLWLWFRFGPIEKSNDRSIEPCGECTSPKADQNRTRGHQKGIYQISVYGQLNDFAFLTETVPESHVQVNETH